MERKFWNEAIETLPREELRELQWKRLRKQMRYIYYHSEFYRKGFQALGIHPDQIKDIEALQAIASLSQ